MSYMNERNRRGKFADRPRQSPYPQWGMETPPRMSNAHKMYRHGDRGVLTKHILTLDEPEDYKGVTRGDVVFLVAVFLVFLLGFNAYFSGMGW